MGGGNLDPQSTTGSPPADDFMDNHSFLQRAENWEKLKKKRDSFDFHSKKFCLAVMQASVYLRTTGLSSTPLMTQQS